MHPPIQSIIKHIFIEVNVSNIVNFQMIYSIKFLLLLSKFMMFHTKFISLKLIFLEVCIESIFILQHLSQMRHCYGSLEHNYMWV